MYGSADFGIDNFRRAIFDLLQIKNRPAFSVLIFISLEETFNIP